MNYTIPRSVYVALEKGFGSKQTVDEFSQSIEIYLTAINTEVLDQYDKTRAQRKYELRDELSKELASKADLHLVQVALKADIDLVKSELKTDMELVRSELKADMELLRSELKADMEAVSSDLEHKIDKNNQLLRILIGLVLFGMTLFNPPFLELIKTIISR